MSVTATLFVQIITFAVLVMFVNRFLWGPLINVMEDRKKKIADGLAAAERGLHEKELAEKKALSILHEAKSNAGEIVNQANKRSSDVIDEAKNQAKEESNRLMAGAHAEIEQEVARAKEHLREKVASLAISGAEKILKKEIDLATHKDILDKVVAEIETSK